MAEVIRIKTNQTTTYEIGTSGGNYVFDAASSVYASAQPAMRLTADADHNTMRIEGTLSGAAGFNGLEVLGTGIRLVIEQSGFVEGATAIEMKNADADLVNRGVIQGYNYGILLTNVSGDVVNHGDIVGEIFGVSQSSSMPIVFENHGTISAVKAIALYNADLTINLGEKSRIFGQTGIDLSGNTALSGQSRITNEGIISSPGAFAIFGSGFEDRVVNTGSIHGAVHLGGGDDRFIDRGQFDGTLYGSDGDDVFVLSSAIVTGELGGGGTDTIRASLSYTLDDNVEKLVLTGKKNLNATGNDDTNSLKGNAANNRLTGDGGTDTLTGAAGRDLFIFENGDGSDTITDFRPGTDRIRISGYDSYTEFADLDISQVGENVRLSFADENGGDAIVLEKLRVRDIDAGDFLFA